MTPHEDRHGGQLVVQYEYVGSAKSDAILWWDDGRRKEWYRRTLSKGDVVWLDKDTINGSASVRTLLACQKLVPYVSIREYSVKWRIQ